MRRNGTLPSVATGMGLGATCGVKQARQGKTRAARYRFDVECRKLTDANKTDTDAQVRRTSRELQDGRELAGGGERG